MAPSATLDDPLDSTSPAIPTSNVFNASNVKEIQQCLSELSRREATVTSRLDSLLESQKDLSRQLSRLDLARAQLGSQVVATRDISHGMLSSASATAHRISGAVKTLDREQAAVRATLEVVEQVAELKACVLGIHGSMSISQQWETAANFLHRASKIPDVVINGAFAEEIVPTTEVPDAPRQTLYNAAESLCMLFLREFEKAAAEGDGARVTRFFKLFPLIGRSDVGLDAYGRYVCSGIAARARNNMSGNQRRDGMFYCNALTKLFEHIAQIVDGHAPLVERHYGPGSMTKVIERIQVEADSQGGLILDTWADERRIHRKLTDVKSYPFNFLVQSFLPTRQQAFGNPRTGSPAPNSGSAGGDDDTVDMKEIDGLLNESAIMLGRWSLYSRFLASKTTLHTDEHDEAPLTFPKFLTHSTLQKKVTDLLIEPFNTMAAFFFRRSVEKSFQLDEPPADLTLNPNKPLGSNPPFITSAVDDVMYIVNQVLQRALTTSQRAVVANVIPAVGRVLGADFFGMIQRKMRDESYPKAAIQGALPPESLIVSFLVLVNNLDVAVDYVNRIVQSSLGTPSSDDNSSTLSDTFPFAHDAIFVERTLHNMQTGFSTKLAELVNEATDVLQKQVMRPRLRPVLNDTFRDVDYMGSGSSNNTSTSHPPTSSDDDVDDPSDPSESSDLVVQRFARGWQAFTLPIKRILTPTLYDRLMAATLAHLARVLERRIWSCYGHINDLGAVRLERDVAGVVATAVQGLRYDLREVFARCVQMTLIMNMEDDEWEEISKLTGAELERESGIAWKLDADERKRTRRIVREG